MSTKCDVTVSEFPGAALAGVSVDTHQSRAQHDCHGLWDKEFMPRMDELTGKACDGSFQSVSYGVSIMTDATGSFTYWAALPYEEDAPLPAGMGRVELAAGLYAHCRVPSLAQIGEAWTRLYMEWPATQSGYRPDMMAPCFECYDEQFPENGSFEIFMPVIKI